MKIHGLPQHIVQGAFPSVAASAATVWVLLVAVAAPGADGPAFSAPRNVTADLRGQTDLSEAGFRMSRNPDSQMVQGPDGRLHLVFWSGPGASDRDRPSRVLYRTWSAASGPGPAIRIDRPDVGRGEPDVGGRHPSLLLAHDGAIWVAWHDHRHCSAGGNWIDNVEIYLDRTGPDGGFAGNNLRLTHTAADHRGDNGFAPKLLQRRSGAIAVAWYDFHYNDIGEIFYRESDAAGRFADDETMADWRLTPATQWGGQAEEAFSFPDLVADSVDVVHLVWTRSNFSFTGDLYYGHLTEPGALEETSLLRPGESNYWYPPRLFAPPSGNAVWVAWTTPAFGATNIHLARRDAGADGAWSAPVTIDQPGAQQSVCAAMDSAGAIHLTWVDNGIWYGRYDPIAERMDPPVQVADASYYKSAFPLPAIHVGPGGDLFILWSEKAEGATVYDGDLYLVFAPGPPIAPAFWLAY